MPHECGLVLIDPACFSLKRGIKFSMDNDKVCTLIINGDKKVQPTPMDLQKKIEAASGVYMQKKDPKKLVEALEELLLFMVNGNSYPKLLMTIIRFVITCDDHRVKKLLGLYWELCDKVKENGDLKEEMVLVWYVICLSFVVNVFPVTPSGTILFMLTSTSEVERSDFCVACDTSRSWSPLSNPF